MTKMCSTCGTQNPLNAKFCSGCGKALKRPVVWPVLLLLLFPIVCFSQAKKDTITTARKELSVSQPTDPHNMSFITYIGPKDYKRHGLIVFKPDTLVVTEIYIEHDTLKVRSSLPLDQAAERFFFALYKSWLEVVTNSKFGKDSK